MVKYQGEKHAILLTTRGFKRANYCGPGTNLKRRRTGKGSKPVSRMDAVCQRHDYAYENAKTLKEVRKADQQMLAELEADPWIPKHEKVVIGTIMRTKIAAETIGVLDRNAFSKIENLRTPGFSDHQNQSAKACNKRANLELCLAEKENGDGNLP